MTGAITLRIAYGYHTLDGPEKDPQMSMFETAANNFSNSTKPAAFLVDIIPARESLHTLKLREHYMNGSSSAPLARVATRRRISHHG